MNCHDLMILVAHIPSNLANTTVGKMIAYHEEKAAAAMVKSWEKEAWYKADQATPVVIRLDGRGFHNFTKGLDYPFDVQMASIMDDVAETLVTELNALVGYSQSDEITLVLHNRSDVSQHIFGGKKFKLESISASVATFWFNHIKTYRLPSKIAVPAYFDSRAFVTPTLDDALIALEWRMRDCAVNSVDMAARAKFGNKALFESNTNDKIYMLKQNGTPITDMPARFRHGCLIVRRVTAGKLSDMDKASLPPLHHAFTKPDKVVRRTCLERLSLPFGDMPTATLKELIVRDA